MRSSEDLRSGQPAGEPPADGGPSGPGLPSAPEPSESAGPSRRRIWLFAVVCLVCLLLSAGYVVRAVRQDRAGSSAAGATEVPLTDLVEVDGRPRLMFQSTAAGEGRGNLAMAPFGDPDGARALTNLGCARLDYSADLGICLTPVRDVLSPAKALIFDASYSVLYSLRVSGIPSRVRVSSDGRWGATTSFVEGHSYADESFSTETLIIDLERGKIVDTLESFAVFRNGERFRNIDFNFWGVTFARDSNRFYATLGTGDHLYLVEGDIRAKEMRVVHDGIECPSLSPDNTRVAFKKRVPTVPGAVAWRVSVLDLATMKETASAETRNVDDQVAWLDDENLIYGLRPSPDSTNADTWTVPADGTGTPRLLVPQAWSAVVAG